MTLTRAGLAALAALGFIAAAGTRTQAATITRWTFENQPITGAHRTATAPLLRPALARPSPSAWTTLTARPARATTRPMLAPQYTQGAEFNVSTVGFTGISVAFDFNPTNRGVEDLELQYNVNIANAGGWTNVGLFSNTVAGGVWNDVAPVSLGAIGAVNNDASFGVRIVSAYHPGTTTYYDTTGAPLNNNSGNVRYDNVTIIGTRSAAVPETSPLALLGLGLLPLGLIAATRRKA